MNANELADLYDAQYEYPEWGSKAQAMLRQLQAENEALKKEAALQRLSDFTQEADNEPVAWAREDGVIAFHNQKEVDSQGYKWFPLYTHPAQELNDGGEPVKNATYWKRQHDRLLINLNVSAIKIAELEKELAILRKAQENG